MIYSSLNNPKIKDIKKLNSKKYRDEMNKFIVEGDHSINEAYDKDCLLYVIIMENYDLDLDIEKIYVTESVMKGLSSLNTPPKCLGICKKIDSHYMGNKIMMLDGVQDPGNLGTIIRSCVAFNFDTLIISSDSVDIYNAKVLRATQGMIFKLNIIIGD